MGEKNFKFKRGDIVLVNRSFNNELDKSSQERYEILLYGKPHRIESLLNLGGRKYRVNNVFVPEKYLKKGV